LEKVESIFDSKFTEIIHEYAKGAFHSYVAQSFTFEEGLIVEEVELRVDGTSKEMVRLIINLNDESNCFTLDRIKQTYPDIYYGSKNRPDPNFQNAKVYFLTNRPWGKIGFAFLAHRRQDCLAGITYIPTKFE
jgi:hypothetical protein